MKIEKSYLHKQLLIILLVTALVGVGIRLTFPPYFNIGKIQPVASYSSTKLFNSFVDNPIDAQGRLGGKAILLEGEITGLDENMILMGVGMEIIRVKLIHDWRYKIPEYKYGDHILIKGICQGIDLSEVLVSHSLIVTVMGK